MPARLAAKAAEMLVPRTPPLDAEEVRQYIGAVLQRKGMFDRFLEQADTPLFAIDSKALAARATEFRDTFTDALPSARFFYAVKSNNHPEIARQLVTLGYGLDVSSGVELEMALECGAHQIVFSGPGKTDDELELAVKHVRRVTVLIDSFGELHRLEQIARRHDIGIRAGVRLTTQEKGIWRKFGIPISDMPLFFAEAEACKHVWLCGIQFHLSWNLSPANHVAFITRLGRALQQLREKYRSEVEFVDIGGGYWPPRGEWLQDQATPRGQVKAAVSPGGLPGQNPTKQQASSLQEFANSIGEAVRKHLLSVVDCEIYTEPGRWVCNDAMHVLLTVIDKKADDIVITDGGINIVGWERYEADYCPIINLSRPSLMEHDCLIAGSLCTPHDIWGYRYFGEDIQPGDVLLIPDQGAYTYSLRQQFIKSLANVVVCSDGDKDTQATSRPLVTKTRSSEVQ